MSITPDILYEILQKIDYLDISRWCRSSPEFANFCRSERGQTLIRQKQQKYREERVEDFLDGLSISDRAGLIGTLERTNYLEQQSGQSQSIPSQFFDQFYQLLEDANELFRQRHPDAYTNFRGLVIPKRAFTIEELDEKNNSTYDVLKQVLLGYYDLLPTVKQNFEQSKYGTGSIGVYGGEAR